MAAEDVVRSMRTRVPWTVAGQMLGSLGLGSRLIDQSQKMTVAASAIAEKKTVGHRS